MKKKLVFLDQISQVGEISFWCRKTIKVMLNQSVALEIPGIIAHQKKIFFNGSIEVIIIRGENMNGKYSLILRSARKLKLCDYFHIYISHKTTF